MIKLHGVIKFWARKPVDLILKESPKRTNVIADPFCGSGTTGFAGLVNRSNQIYLSDLNPVSVFMTSTLLSKVTLSEEIFTYFINFCKDLENEVYRIRDHKVSYAVWITILECPKCGYQFKVRKMPDEVKCKKCHVKLAPRFFELREKLLQIYVEKNGKTVKITDKKILHEYVRDQEKLSLKHWYPHGTFNYPDSEVEFRDGPHRRLEIKEIFTKRNLYAVSKIYDKIERLWKNDPKQGDIFKLAFIASLVNATKMIPHAESSGPSWKIPRYWIPNVREERNFCKAFVRRLKVIKAFKEKLLSTLLNDYEISTVYEHSPVSHNGNEGNSKAINIFRSDARDAHEFLPKCDFIVLDPPHYDQVDYYELYYLWQKWLEGRLSDARFRDFNHWKNEISVNNRVGRDLDYYNNSISEVVFSYAKILRRHGKLVLILHNRDLAVLERTVKDIKEKLRGFRIKSKCEWPRVPSSMQGIHGRKKFIYILRIYRN